MRKGIIVFALLSIVVMLAFWIRIQGVESLPAGQFTETDGYFYYWQASLISEHGHLPARDLHRWLPLGRDLGQTLNLYGYLLAYTHKAVSQIFPNITLYHVSLYMPVVCFCIGLGALCLYLYHTYGLMFSLTAGVILATLPGSIERSTAGFGDRDAWCLMIGILTVITYLTSLQAETPRKRLFWTLTSGFFVFLGGISWEGFGVFLSVIIVVELWRFLSTERDERVRYYLLWVFCFVPTLYAASEAYRNGYGFAEHLAAFVLVPPVVVLGMRALRYLLVSKVDVLRPHARSLSLGLILLSIVLAIGYVFFQRQTFADTTVPLSQSALMQAMKELRNPHLAYWVYRYGGVLFLGSLGFIVLVFSLSQRHKLFLSIALAGFTVFSFFREQGDHVLGVPFGNALFGITLAGCTCGILWLAWRKQRHTEKDNTAIAFITWFIVWVALARDAKRYDFFIGVSLAYATAVLIQAITDALSEKIHRWGFAVAKDFTRRRSETAIFVILLILLMFLPVKYTHTYRAHLTAKNMRSVTPQEHVAEAMRWMKTTLPHTAIVAANWGYGSQLNVIAGVKTVIDQDTYIPHWIDLYYRKVIYAENESEALGFLKTHNATHLMLVGEQPAKDFLEGQLSDAFLPIYPEENFTHASVCVWELHYPPDIKTDPKYLKTGFPALDAQIRIQPK